MISERSHFELVQRPKLRNQINSNIPPPQLPLNTPCLYNNTKKLTYILAFSRKTHFYLTGVFKISKFVLIILMCCSQILSRSCLNRWWEVPLRLWRICWRNPSNFYIRNTTSSISSGLIISFLIRCKTKQKTCFSVSWKLFLNALLLLFAISFVSSEELVKVNEVLERLEIFSRKKEKPINGMDECFFESHNFFN